MSSDNFSKTVCVYPKMLAQRLMPTGLPQGELTLGIMFEANRFHFFKVIKSPNWTERNYPTAGLAAKRELGKDFIDHATKFLPKFKFPLYGLQRAADWLESWVDNTLPASPLLDVSACLGKCYSHISRDIVGTLMQTATMFLIQLLLQGHDYDWSLGYTCCWLSAKCRELCSVPK